MSGADDMLRKALEGVRDLLAEFWDRVDSDVKEGSWDADGPWGELDELPLEIVWEKGEPFAVVLGTGGPHIEIRGGTRHDGNAYVLHGYWSGEHVTLGEHSSTPTASPGPIERTGEYFREMVESGDES